MAIRHYKLEDGIWGYEAGDILVDETGARSLAVADGRGVTLKPLKDSMSEAQLYWDAQDPANAGWWLRYRDAHGTEQGTAIEAPQDASTAQLAAAVERETHWIGEGTIQVIRGEQQRDHESITIADGEVTWRSE